MCTHLSCTFFTINLLDWCGVVWCGVGTVFQEIFALLTSNETEFSRKVTIVGDNQSDHWSMINDCVSLLCLKHR